MLQRYEEHSRRAVAEPVAGEWRSSTGSIAETARRPQREVTLVVDDRVANVRMLVVVLRKEDGCPQVDGVSPSLRENRALDLDPPHVLVVVRYGDWRKDLVGNEPNGRTAGRIPGDPDWIAVQIARRPLPALPLPLVHREPDRVTVGAVKSGVHGHEP